MGFVFVTIANETFFIEDNTTTFYDQLIILIVTASAELKLVCI